MGRQVFPVIGGLIGAAGAFFATGGTATYQGYAAGFAIGSAIGGVAGSYIDPIVIQGNTIGDSDMQVAAEGGVRAIMYGRACVTATTVIARGNRKVVKKKDSNGKGSSGSTANQYVYWTFAIGLGEALTQAAIGRIWQDDTLVYDVLGDGTVSDDDNAAFAAKFKFYNGAETQLPDPDLQVFLGDDTPYFRGTAYVVFPQFDLTSTAERIPQFKFEVMQNVTSVGDNVTIIPAGSSEWKYALLEHSDDTDLSAIAYGDFPGVVATAPFGSSPWGYPVDAPSLNGFSDTPTTVIPKSKQLWVCGQFSLTIVPLTGTLTFQCFVDNRVKFYVNGTLAASFGPVDYPGSFYTSIDLPLSLLVQGVNTITSQAIDDGASDDTDNWAWYDMRLLGPGTQIDSPITLASVADDLLLKSGMTTDQWDTSELSDLIAGVCIQDTSTGAAALSAIIGPYFADPTEKDTKLTWVKRGAPVIRTLTADDLTEEPDAPSRENVIEYPAKLSYFYQSPLTGYATTKATSYRYSPQVDSSGEGSVTSPVTYYTSDEPAQIAQKLHKVAWTEAEGSFVWNVGMHCIDLLPADCVGLFLRGIVTRARITAIENNGSTLKLTMLKDRQSSYTSNVTGIVLPTPTPPQPATMSKAVLAVLDIPALQDTDDALVYYTAMSGSTSTWQGGELQRSLDGGASYQPIGEVTTDVTMGRLTVAMDATSAAYTDTTNAVKVQLFDSANDIIAYSETNFNQEQGAIAVQLASGAWEVMQYRDATDGGSGLWTLTTLKRGRLNTLPGAHAVGALFVLLDSHLVKNSADVAWLNSTIKHRAVSYGTNNETADVVSTVYEGESQREWAPASATVEYDGATSVAVTDIVPRYRFGTELNPLASVNLTGYRITATDGTTTVTTDITGGSAYMTLAGAPTAVTVAAINKITGDGDALTLTDYTLVPTGSLVPTAIVNAGGAA